MAQLYMQPAVYSNVCIDKGWWLQLFAEFSALMISGNTYTSWSIKRVRNSLLLQLWIAALLTKKSKQQAPVLTIHSWLCKLADNNGHLCSLTKLSKPVPHQHKANATHLHTNATDIKIVKCLTPYDAENNTLIHSTMILYNTLCRHTCRVVLRQQNVVNDITTEWCSAVLHLQADILLNWSLQGYKCFSSLCIKLTDQRKATPRFCSNPAKPCQLLIL